MQFTVNNAGFLPSFSKKSFCGVSVKNQDILINSETNPQMLILLCASTCRSTTKSYPEDLQESFRLTESQSPYPGSACHGCILTLFWSCCFKKTVLTSSQGNMVCCTCLMQVSINQLEEERASPSIHEGKNSVGSCSQSVHCSFAHLHGPLGVQHSVTSPCSLCNPQQKGANTSKTRNISSDAIFCST